MSNAVSKFNSAVKTLHKDQSDEAKAKTAEAKAEKAEKTGAASEKTALASISSQEQAIIDEFVPTSGTPSTLTPAQQQAALSQLYNLGKEQVTTQDHFTSAIAADKKTASADAKDVAEDKKTVDKAYAAAKKDLTPAENVSDLKQTNRERAELGLGKVDHVIRTGVKQTVPGQVGKWIAEAQTALEAAGIPMSKMNAADINLIIQHESSGNPNAVNNWDINAQEGHPSEGLMQTIAPTFNEYKLPGHNDILNPVDNIIAGVRYAISRYGSISNVPGVIAVHDGGSYVGY